MNLEAVGKETLTPLVRKATRRSEVEIDDWSYRDIYVPVLRTTGGVYLFNGSGHDSAGSLSWSLVLKILNSPTIPTGVSQDADTTRTFYWKREALVYQSGILDGLPDGFRAARCLEVTEHSEGIWMWLEYVPENVEAQWPLSRYGRAAYCLGLFNGTYLTSGVLPSQPWLNRKLVRERVEGRASRYAQLPNQLHQPSVRRCWPDDLLNRLQRLLEEKEEFLSVLDLLPQTFRHGDADRRNLLAQRCADGREEMVAIDWAFAGIGPVGEEVGALVGTSALFLVFPPTQLHELAEEAFSNYLQGLREAGWTGDETLVRLGATATAALRFTFTPLLECVDEAGRPEVEKIVGRSWEETVDGLTEVRRWALGMVDEAKVLMRSL